MATKQKTIKADNARIFFTLTHCQFFNGVIPALVYVERLVKLRSLISSGSALYQILSDILDELQIKLPKEKRCKIVELGKNYKISEVVKAEIDRTARTVGGLMELRGRIRVADKDQFPSIPHIHAENGDKINIYTGERYSHTDSHTPVGKISDKDLVKIWNEDDYEKIKSHMETFKLRLK